MLILIVFVIIHFFFCRYQRLKKLVSEIDGIEKLNENGPKIQAFLKDGVVCNGEINPIPSVMITMIKKADRLISSDNYCAIIKVKSEGHFISNH